VLIKSDIASHNEPVEKPPNQALIIENVISYDSKQPINPIYDRSSMA
jgi:hypothetical protein